jgi:AcrR family transcriptional regulator
VGAFDEPTTDGRLARGRRTRRAVADALVAALRDGEPDPTAKAVAARAGVSPRLVFHHFTDIDDLYHYVAVLHLRRHDTELPRLSPRLPRERRVDRTVAHRAALYEEIAPARRALARRVTSSACVAEVLASCERVLLENLAATFAPELTRLSHEARLERLATMDTATSWAVWDRLRTTSGFGARTARRVMAQMLALVCNGADETGGTIATTTGFWPGDGTL